MTGSRHTSSIAYSYDAGDRITQLVDTANGTITRSYDGLDRLVSESTPQGTVSYAYDAAGRRTQLSAPAQSTTTYTFDNANRLTAIARGSQSVTFVCQRHRDRGRSELLVRRRRKAGSAGRQLRANNLPAGISGQLTTPATGSAPGTALRSRMT